MSRLMQIVRSEGFDELRVADWDRAARLGAFDVAPLVNLLREAGAVVYDVTTGRETDPCTSEGRTVLSEASQRAEAERESILNRTAGGRLERLLDGRHPNGGLPWGLREVKGNDPAYSWDENVVGILRHAMTRLIEGLSLRDVCSELEARGWFSPRGKRWGHGSMLAKAVHAECYLGHWHGTAVRETREIRVPVAIDPELVHSARRALSQRNKRPVNGRTVDALIRGRAICGTCRRTMHVSPATGHRRYDYYRCSTCLKGSNVCHDLAEVDRRVWAALIDDVLTDFSVTAALGSLAATAPEDDGSVARLESELTKRKVRLDAVVEALGDDLSSTETMKLRLRGLAAEFTEAEERLRAARQRADMARRSHANADALRGDLLKRAAGLRSEMAGAHFATRRELIAALEVEVTLYSDRWAEMTTALSSIVLAPPPKSRASGQFMVAPSAP